MYSCTASFETLLCACLLACCGHSCFYATNLLITHNSSSSTEKSKRQVLEMRSALCMHGKCMRMRVRVYVCVWICTTRNNSRSHSNRQNRNRLSFQLLCSIQTEKHTAYCTIFMYTSVHTGTHAHSHRHIQAMHTSSSLIVLQLLRETQNTLYTLANTCAMRQFSSFRMFVCLLFVHLNVCRA